MGTSCGALRPSGTRQQDLNTLRRAALLRWRRRSPEVPAPIHSRHTRTLFVPAAFGVKDSEMHIYVDDACSSQVQRARLREKRVQTRVGSIGSSCHHKE